MWGGWGDLAGSAVRRGLALPEVVLSSTLAGARSLGS